MNHNNISEVDLLLLAMSAPNDLVTLESLILRHLEIWYNTSSTARLFSRVPGGGTILLSASRKVVGLRFGTVPPLIKLSMVVLCI